METYVTLEKYIPMQTFKKINILFFLLILFVLIIMPNISARIVNKFLYIPGNGDSIESVIKLTIDTSDGSYITTQYWPIWNPVLLDLTLLVETGNPLEPYREVYYEKCGPGGNIVTRGENPTDLTCRYGIRRDRDETDVYYDQLNYPGAELPENLEDQIFNRELIKEFKGTILGIGSWVASAGTIPTIQQYLEGDSLGQAIGTNYVPFWGSIRAMINSNNGYDLTGAISACISQGATFGAGGLKVYKSYKSQAEWVNGIKTSMDNPSSNSKRVFYVMPDGETFIGEPSISRWDRSSSHFGIFPAYGRDNVDIFVNKILDKAQRKNMNLGFKQYVEFKFGYDLYLDMYRAIAMQEGSLDFRNPNQLGRISRMFFRNKDEITRIELFEEWFHTKDFFNSKRTLTRLDSNRAHIILYSNRFLNHKNFLKLTPQEIEFIDARLEYHAGKILEEKMKNH
ncbi:MAG: hypothetical protein WC438_00740 [Candidatus Pacearchaeota archaeon]